MSIITGSDFQAIMGAIGSFHDTRIGSVSLDAFNQGSVTHVIGSTLAISQQLTEGDEIVRQGTMNVGDLRVFLRDDNTDLDLNTAGEDTAQIGREAFWYERDGFPIVHKVGSFINHREMLFRKNEEQ